jgi:hypothetical protein
MESLGRFSGSNQIQARSKEATSSDRADVLDQDQIAEICRSAFPDRTHRSLLSMLRQLYPRVPFTVSLSQDGWYRTGGIVTARGEKVAEDLVRWAYREGENDFPGLLDYCRKAGLFATRIDGKIHYIVAPNGPRAMDFFQIEVEEIQEMVDRPLCGDTPPVDIEDFIDPIAPSMEQNRPLGSPRYKLKRLTHIADLLASIKRHGAEHAALRRFMRDWDCSSAARHHSFCHHWILELHSYTGRYDEQCHSITPYSSYLHPIPQLEDAAASHGAHLANQLRHFDRKLGYPMAWYFYLLKRDYVPSQLAQAVSDDHDNSYAYLPDSDRQLVQDWLAQPYLL